MRNLRIKNTFESTTPIFLFGLVSLFMLGCKHPTIDKDSPFALKDICSVYVGTIEVEDTTINAKLNVCLAGNDGLSISVTDIYDMKSESNRCGLEGHVEGCEMHVIDKSGLINHEIVLEIEESARNCIKLTGSGKGWGKWEFKKSH